MPSNSNRGVVYLKPGRVEVQNIDFPTFRNPAGKTIDHGVILKVVTTNICGSDQHKVLGHEIEDNLAYTAIRRYQSDNHELLDLLATEAWSALTDAKDVVGMFGPWPRRV
jgi:hypothetical protein